MIFASGRTDSNESRLSICRYVFRRLLYKEMYVVNTVNYKEYSSQFEKFYKCMLEHYMVKKEDYQELTETIKENMDEWLEDCSMYNDPDQDNPFYLFDV